MREVRRVNLSKIAREESILSLWSATRTHHSHTMSLTLAISSLFFNSPSTMMTCPFPSTSVHRSLGSKAAFAVSDLRAKMDPDSSSSCSRRSSSVSCMLPFVPRPKSQSFHFGRHLSRGDWFDEEFRCAPKLVFESVVARGLRGDLGRIESNGQRPACITASRLGSDVLRRRAHGFDRGAAEKVALERPLRLIIAAHLGSPVKKPTPSDCARRNRRRFCDGAAGGRNAGGIAAGGEGGMGLLLKTGEFSRPRRLRLCGRNSTRSACVAVWDAVFGRLDPLISVPSSANPTIFSRLVPPTAPALRYPSPTLHHGVSHIKVDISVSVGFMGSSVGILPCRFR